MITFKTATMQEGAIGNCKRSQEEILTHGILIKLTGIDPTDMEFQALSEWVLFDNLPEGYLYDTVTREMWEKNDDPDRDLDKLMRSKLPILIDAYKKKSLHGLAVGLACFAAWTWLFGEDKLPEDLRVLPDAKNKWARKQVQAVCNYLGEDFKELTK